MPEKFEHLVAVIIRTWSDKATEPDNRDLNEWLDASTENRWWYERFYDKIWIKPRLKKFDNIDVDNGRTKLWAKIEAYEQEKSRRKWHTGYWAAAATVVIVAGLAIWGIPDKKSALPITVKTDTIVKPGIDTAVLELANGQAIQLRPETNGNIASYGNLQFVKNGGQVSAIRLNRKEAKHIEYHNIRIPKGGHFQLVLPDSTKVWLNSASSIRFPSAFTGDKRSVMLTGEAYFEVQKDSRRPFTVFTNSVEIEALGTKFNVNAYSDEEKVTTSLLEGQLKVSVNEKYVVLNPTQSAIISDAKTIRVDSTIQMDKITAWHMGDFDFHGDSLTSVVRQLARWYDLNIIYEDHPAVIVSYIGSRSQDIDSVIRGLMKGDKNIHIKRIGKNLILKPPPPQ